jgi:uncharacterized membrane protein
MAPKKNLADPSEDLLKMATQLLTMVCFLCACMYAHRFIT